MKSQSTQNSNAHLLAYIPSRWKYLPRLVSWGVYAHSLSNIFTITNKVVVYAPAEMADSLPLFLLYPFMYSVGEVWRMTDGPWIFIYYKFPFWMAPVQSYIGKRKKISPPIVQKRDWRGEWGRGGGRGGEED